MRTSSGCQCGGSFQPGENRTRDTNTPGLVGSPNRTIVCGGPESGPLNSMSCGSFRTCALSGALVRANKSEGNNHSQPGLNFHSSSSHWRVLPCLQSLPRCIGPRTWPKLRKVSAAQPTQTPGPLLLADLDNSPMIKYLVTARPWSRPRAVENATGASDRFAVERREALGLTLRARAPRDPHHPQKPRVPEARRAGGPIARAALWEPRKLPGASRRSIPSGETEKWERRAPNVSKQPAAKRWLTACKRLSEPAKIFPNDLASCTTFVGSERTPRLSTPRSRGAACRARPTS